MAKRVQIDDLANEISETLKDYIGVTEEACERGVIETADEAVKDLRSAHPSGSGEWGSWDNYNRSWGYKKDKGKIKKGLLAIVHNKKYYRLTHLLEKGHAKTNGGRTRAFPHIAPVEKKCENLLLENIKKGI